MLGVFQAWYYYDVIVFTCIINNNVHVNTRCQFPCFEVYNTSHLCMSYSTLPIDFANLCSSIANLAEEGAALKNDHILLLKEPNQWRSQDIAVARAQHGHTTFV